MMPPYIAHAAECERLYLSGLTTGQVGARLHLSGTTVRRALEHRKVAMRPAGRHGRHVVPVGRCTLAAGLRASGLSWAVLADRLGTSPSTARRWALRGEAESA